MLMQVVLDCPSGGTDETLPASLKHVHSFLSGCCYLLLDLNDHVAPVNKSDAGALSW